MPSSCQFSLLFLFSSDSSLKHKHLDNHNNKPNKQQQQCQRQTAPAGAKLYDNKKNYFLDDLLQLVIIRLNSLRNLLNVFLVLVSFLDNLILLLVDLPDFALDPLNTIDDSVQGIVHLLVSLGILAHGLLFFNVRVSELIFTTFCWVVNHEILLFDVR